MAGTGISKKIRWTDKQWICEPFVIELYLGKGDNRIPVDIDPESVAISDTKDWLEIGNEGKPIKGEGKVWKVPIKVKDNKIKGIIPPAVDIMKYKPPVVHIGTIPEIKNYPPPIKQLSTTLTVTADAKDTRSIGADVTGSVAVAGAGLTRGLGKVISGAMRKISAGPPVEYIIEPPIPFWVIEDDESFPLCGTLSGKASEQKLKLKLDPLPVGWNSGLKIDIGLPPKASKNLGLVLVQEPENLSGTSNEIRPVAEISVNLKLSNSICCMKKVQEISAEENPFDLSLYVVTRNEYIGGPRQKIDIKLLPLEICLYLDGIPQNNFHWNGHDPVRVIRKDTADIPSKSQFPLWLQHSLECNPSVNWTFDKETALDDKFSSESALKTQYIAPSEEKWTEEERPKERSFQCVVGDGKEEKEIKEVPEKLYSTAILKSNILLKAPLGIAVVQIKISPSNLPKKGENKMDLITTDVLDLFHRTFTLRVDLQKVGDKKEVVEKFGGDHDA